MSKLRAVELAVEFLRGRDGFAGSAVVEIARSIAEFIGDETPSDVAEVKAALKSSARKAKTVDAAPVVAVDATPAANESTSAAEVEKIKVQMEMGDATPITKAEPKAEVKTEVKAEPVTTAVKSAVTMEEVKALVGKLATNAAAGGAPKAREILGLYGATNISTLKPEKYALVKASLEAILEAAAIAA